MAPDSSNLPQLLMVGMSSETYRVGNRVRKQCRLLAYDPAISAQNLDACHTEADVYLILGTHPLITRCTSVAPSREYVELEFYDNGTLKEYISRNWDIVTRAQLECWGVQMIQSIDYLHTKGVRHSDLRLDQWLVDEAGNARLSDFNAAGFDAQPTLGLEGKPALGFETASHYLPRPYDADNCVASDLFALGSCLYELATGRQPYEGRGDDEIEYFYAKCDFPSTEGLLFEEEIFGCWNQKFSRARDILDAREKRMHHLTSIDPTNEVEKL